VLNHPLLQAEVHEMTKKIDAALEPKE
jgi:hypothetical protein